MMPQAGGMLRYGIPEYRLEKDMMDREFDGVWELGVDKQYNVKLGVDFTIDDLFARRLRRRLSGHRRVDLERAGPASIRMTPGVINAITYLMDKTQGLPVPVDDTKEVVVLGGGFTTFDCTRTSLRLGAKVHTVYRRGRKEMSATFEEVEDGQSEGTDLQLFAAATAHRARRWQSRRARVPAHAAWRAGCLGSPPARADSGQRVSSSTATPSSLPTGRSPTEAVLPQSRASSGRSARPSRRIPTTS